MTMHPVTSSNIEAVGWEHRPATDKFDAHTVLRVQFRHGRAYEYVGVPFPVYMQLLNAESVGGYFARHVRNDYLVVPVTVTDTDNDDAPQDRP